MAILRLFGPARHAAGVGRDILSGDTVGEVVSSAVARYGDGLGALVPKCVLWVNGEPAALDTKVGPDDEVAVLPPVSGG